MRNTVVGILFLVLACASTASAAVIATGGAVASVDHVFQTVNFSQAFDGGVTPIIVALDDNNDSASATPPAGLRIRNVSNTGFELALLEPLDSGGTETGATSPSEVHYIAVAPGTYQWGPLTVEAGSVDTQAVQGQNSGGTPKFTAGSESWTTVNFTAPFTADPAVAGFIQTMNNDNITSGEDNSTPENSLPWLQAAVRGIGTTNDPATGGGVDLALERAEVTHDGTADNTNINAGISADETIGYIAISQGVTQFDGILLESAVTGDFVEEISASGTYSFQADFASAPLVTGSMAARQGDDGGWLRRTSNLTAEEVDLFLQEDIYDDAELAHSENPASIFAFSQAFVITDETVFVPEPSTLAMLCLGIGALLVVRKQR